MKRKVSIRGRVTKKRRAGPRAGPRAGSRRIKRGRQRQCSSCASNRVSCTCLAACADKSGDSRRYKVSNSLGTHRIYKVVHLEPCLWKCRPSGRGISSDLDEDPRSARRTQHTMAAVMFRTTMSARDNISLSETECSASTKLVLAARTGRQNPGKLNHDDMHSL